MTEAAVKAMEVQAKMYPEGYVPSEEEEYMNPVQVAFFKDMLLDWRLQLEEESTSTVKELKENSSIEPDLNDQASLEYGQTVELRTRDRERKLISKIDEDMQVNQCIHKK